MVIKAGKRNLRVAEIPIDYRPRLGESKLSRVSDAWRHVRFMLVHSPTFLFLVPGGLVALGSVAGLVVLGVMNGLADRWTGVSAALGMLVLVGLGAIQLGLFARTYAIVYLGESGASFERLWQRLRLEHGLARRRDHACRRARDHGDVVLRPDAGSAAGDSRTHACRGRLPRNLRGLLPEHPRPQ